MLRVGNVQNTGARYFCTRRSPHRQQCYRTGSPQPATDASMAEAGVGIGGFVLGSVVVVVCSGSVAVQNGTVAANVTAADK